MGCEGKYPLTSRTQSGQDEIAVTGQDCYQTGDPHPKFKSLAFVEYCDDGHAVWVSISEDSEVPFRLARASGLHPPPCSNPSDRISCSDTSTPFVDQGVGADQLK